mmetsp:Transcript_17468/g.55699  ORF Transcript_17468/g.55699 Transcript_17468/m.55699 type:complete len:792 (-) Transcript_17468:58-2433(-)
MAELNWWFELRVLPARGGRGGRTRRCWRLLGDGVLGPVDEALAVVEGVEEVGKNERENGHELHDNVEGRARGVLERIADSVTDDGSLVDFAALGLHDAVHVDAALLNVLLGVVPSTASVGGGDGHLHGRGDSAGQEASHRGLAKEDTGDERGGHDEKARGDHLAERGVGRDLDAARVVGGSMASLVVEEAGNGVELALDLLDHLVGGNADRLHGHGREPVRNHSADQEGSKDTRGKDRNGVRAELRASDEGTEEREANEASRADREALADGSSGVASGVESIGLLAHLLGEAGHLGDTTGVVGDGTVSVDGEADREGREHAEGGEGHAVEAAEVEGGENGEGEEEDRDDGRLVAEGKTVDDESGGASLTGLGHLADRAVRVRGVVLGDEAGEETGPEAGEQADEDAPPGLGLEDALGLDIEGELLGDEEPAGEREERGEEDGGEDELDLEDLLNILALLDRADVGGDERGEDAGEDADGRDNEREEHGTEVALELAGGGAEDEGGAGGLGEGAEEVSAHTGNVTDVVTDVVSDGGGVAGVVLGDVLLNLADKVSANVSSLGVDTATDATEERNGRAAEAEAGDALEEGAGGAGRLGEAEDLVEGDAEDVEGDERDTAEAVAHDATSAEGGVEALGPGGDGVEGRDGGARVGEDSDLHAEVARHDRGEGTDHEGQGGKATLLPVSMSTRARVVGDARSEEEDEGAEGDDEDEADLVLGVEEGVSAEADGVVDLDQAVLVVVVGEEAEGAVIAGGLQADLGDQAELVDREEHADDAAHDDEDAGCDINFRHGI